MKNVTLSIILVLLFACSKQEQPTSSIPGQTSMDETSTKVATPVTIQAAPVPASVTQGLTPAGVFDTPTPVNFSYSDKFPGSSTVLPRAYPNAPPQIPHSIDGFKPVTAALNACLGCHNNPSMWGKNTKGLPTPIPKSHYTDLRNTPTQTTEQITGARYVCTQCHVPQALLDPLVENSFNTGS